MTIQVCSYTADYVIRNQPDWGKIYDTLQEAIAAARFAYNSLTNYDDRYTAVEVEKDGKIYTVFIIYKGQEAFGKEAGLLALILSEEVFFEHEAA